MQFVAITFIGRDSVHAFLVMVALGFVAGAWVSHSNTGAAARTADNEDVMRVLPRVRLTLLLALVGILGVVGVIVSLVGAGASPIVFILLGCNVVLLVAQLQWFKWWKRVLEPDGAT